MTEAQVRNIKIFGESIEKFIETHISFVILTKAHAYKIKKAIQFSFLDFSSIAKRKFYCDQELKLNQRLAGDMYLDVVPVRQKDGQFLIHSQTGAIADHALQMRRMDNRKEMHRMLQSHSVTHADIVKIAEILVNFHRSLPGIMEPLDARALKDIFNDIRSIEGILNRDFAGKYTGLVSQVRSFSDHFIDSHSTVLEERIRRGLIKDCHGDLHTRNIFLLNEPVIFDCIEFNAAFRQIDILYELAFFCMDLDAEGFEELSDHFIKAYRKLYPEVLMESSDTVLLLYYKLYRANVRAKVTVLKVEQADNNQERQTFIKEAEKYLDLMQGYLTKLS